MSHLQILMSHLNEISPVPHVTKGLSDGSIYSSWVPPSQINACIHGSWLILELLSLLEGKDESFTIIRRGHAHNLTVVAVKKKKKHEII